RRSSSRARSAKARSSPCSAISATSTSRRIYGSDGRNGVPSACNKLSPSGKTNNPNGTYPRTLLPELSAHADQGADPLPAGEEVRPRFQYSRRQRVRGNGPGRGRVRRQFRSDRTRADLAAQHPRNGRANRKERDRVDHARAMPLTDAQIDRYSRQIIVPHIGGRGQERLLAARILLAGDARDIEAPLAYLGGAGVGSISLKPSADHSLITEKNVDLALVIIGSEAARKIAEEIANDRDVRALVIA